MPNPFHNSWTDLWGGGNKKNQPQANTEVVPSQPYEGSAPESFNQAERYFSDGWGGLNSSQIQTRLAGGVREDFLAQAEAGKANQELAKQQADKYIQESQAHRQNSLGEINKNRTWGLENIYASQGNAKRDQDRLMAEGDMAADVLTGEANKMRENSQAAYDTAAGQLENSRNQVFNVWDQLQEQLGESQKRSEALYADATKGFQDFQKFRDDVMKQGRADADKVIASYMDQTAQKTSLALRGLQDQEKEAIAAIQEAAARDPSMTPDRVRAQIDQVRRDSQFKRSEIAVQSGLQANETQANLAKEMYGNLTAVGGQMASATAQAYDSYVGAGKALQEVLTNNSASLSAAAGKVMDAVTNIGNAYAQLGGKMMETEQAAGLMTAKGQELKTEMYLEGAKIAAEVDKTAMQESSVLLNSHNETMAKLDSLSMLMRDAEYTSFMDAYSTRVTPVLPYMAMLGELSLSEQQRQFSNMMSTISMIFSGVTTFANAYGTIKEANRPPPEQPNFFESLFGGAGTAVVSGSMGGIWGGGGGKKAP